MAWRLASGVGVSSGVVGRLWYAAPRGTPGPSGYEISVGDREREELRARRTTLSRMRLRGACQGLVGLEWVW